MFLLALLACDASPDDTAEPTPADPEVVLVDLAREVGDSLYIELYFAVGMDTVFYMEDGDHLSGTLSFPDDADPEHWETDGTFTADWSVDYRDDPDEEGLRYWDWTVALDIETLVLPSATVSGEATWTVTHESYDYDNASHGWSGAIAVDGADPVDTEWTGWGSWGELNAMEGTIDGQAVEWENPDPDLP